MQATEPDDREHLRAVLRSPWLLQCDTSGILHPLRDQFDPRLDLRKQS